MDVAGKVKQLRYNKGWGPDELAAKAGISRTALYQIECGKTEMPRAGTLLKVANALGVGIETILGSQPQAPVQVVQHRETLRDQEVISKMQALLDSPLRDGGGQRHRDDLRELTSLPAKEGLRSRCKMVAIV